MSKKILYIEDDEYNKILVNKILTARGYEVLEADNGLQGIELAGRIRPDLMLIDINMPGLDGYETTTRIKDMDELKDIPVIALSAKGSSDDRERGLIAGCDGYITKPIDIESFVSTVETYLGGKKEYVAKEREPELLKGYSRYLVRDLEGKVRELEAANRDLEKRVAERTAELELAQEKLIKVEKKKALLELTGAAAHELNQPLTVILSLVEVVLSNMGGNNENYDLMEKVRGECLRAAGIVKQMGNISEYRTKNYYKGIDIIDIDKSSS